MTFKVCKIHHYNVIRKFAKPPICSSSTVQMAYCSISTSTHLDAYIRMHLCCLIYYFLSQVDGSNLELCHFPPGARGVLWENWPLDKVVSLFTYVYAMWLDVIIGYMLMLIRSIHFVICSTSS